MSRGTSGPKVGAPPKATARLGPIDLGKPATSLRLITPSAAHADHGWSRRLSSRSPTPATFYSLGCNRAPTMQKNSLNQGDRCMDVAPAFSTNAVALVL